jgi:flavodoxin
MAGHVLVAYFSRSGNTRRIANLIQRQVGGTLYEIQPEEPYPDSYHAAVDQAKVEIQAGYKPALRSRLDDTESYDTVFVGSPNWWDTIAPPVATFLSENDLSGKTIVPFCTHGGGGLGRAGQGVGVAGQGRSDALRLRFKADDKVLPTASTAKAVAG